MSFIPSSVTWVPRRLSRANLVSPFKLASRASVILAESSSNTLRFVNDLSWAKPRVR